MTFILKWSILQMGKKHTKNTEKKDDSLGAKEIFIAVASSAVTALLVWVINVPIDLGNISYQISDIKDSIQSINDSQKETNNKIESLRGIMDDNIENLRDEMNANVTRLQNSINDQDDRIDGYHTYQPVFQQPSSDAKNAIYSTYNPNANYNTQAMPLYETVAFDQKTGQEYTGEELINQKFLLAYENKGEDVLFLGQFNESGQWDGLCIINVYENGKLKFITEAIYENGISIRSKQVFYYQMASKQNVCAVAYRMRNTDLDGNPTDSLYGNTRIYIKKQDYPLNFSFDDATWEDVLSVNSFESKIDAPLHAIYKGNTSKGYFNDNTGDACMVYFFDDGYVRLLYVGNFKDGTFDDDTGNAWYIVRNENTSYMYYKGCFKNGVENRNREFKFENYLTQQRIYEIMQENKFNFYDDLVWSDAVTSA